MYRTHIPPIERDTLNYVQIRIAVRMVILDFHKRPERYHVSPATAALDLAYRSRLLFPLLFQSLVFVAKAMSEGCKLKDIRQYTLDYAPRALHKRRLPSRHRG